jgi:lambda family phage tail tape measure protein
MTTRVIITAEDQTAAGIASVKSSMVGLGATIGAVSSVMTTLIDMMGEVARTTVALYKDQINLADSMDEMSARMGMSIRDLTVWKAAAEMNGTSLDAMANGTRMLAKHMTEHGAALRKAGIDTRDTNTAFLQLSDLFKSMTDPVARIDLATRLFGRGMGQQLLPVLIQGSEALKETQAEAGKYGDALQRLSPEAQKLNDTMYLMGVNFKTAAAEGIFPLVKHFNDEMLPAMREVAKEGSLLKTIWIGFGGAMKTGFADPWNQTLLGAKATLQQFMSDVEAMLAKLTFGRASEIHLRESQRMAEAAKKTLAEAAGYGRAPGSPAPEAGQDAPGAGDTAEILACEISGGKWDAKTRTCIRKSAGSTAKTPLQKMIELGDRNLAASKAKEYVAADDDEEARLGAHKREMESLRLQAKEAESVEKMRQKYVEMADPLQKYRVQLDEINMLRDKGLLTAAQAIEAEWAVNEAMDKTIEKMGEVKDGGKDAFAELSQAITSWGNKAADTFADFVVDGKASFSNLINSMLKDIVRLQAKQYLDPITKGASGFLSGMFDNIFGKSGSSVQLATGGVMSGPGISAFSGSIVNRPTLFPFAKGIGLMGEAGEEAILPLKRGADGKLGVAGGGGGGVTVVQHLNFSVGVAQTVRAEVMNLMPQIQAAAQGAVIDARLRGGSTRSAFRG